VSSLCGPLGVRLSEACEVEALRPVALDVDGPTGPAHALRSSLQVYRWAGSRLRGSVVCALVPLLSDPPDHYFIVVNDAWPSTRATLGSDGRFVSAAFAAMRAAPDLVSAYDAGTLDYRPYIENLDWIGRWSVPGRSAGLRYRVNHDAEIVRRQHCPLSPSRFSAIFAFADEQSCKCAEVQMEWKTQDTRKFRLLPDPRNRVARVNMHTFTAAQYLYMTERDFSLSEREQLWLPYWDGKEPPSRSLQPHSPDWSTPLWEYLIDGELQLMC
jgi:hypothetical protein